MHCVRFYWFILTFQVVEEDDSDENWDFCKDSGSDTEDDAEYEKEKNVKGLLVGQSPTHELAAV